MRCTCVRNACHRHAHRRFHCCTVPDIAVLLQLKVYTQFFPLHERTVKEPIPVAKGSTASLTRGRYDASTPAGDGFVIVAETPDADLTSC